MVLNLESEIIGTSKLSYRYQINVPIEVRKRFNLKETDQLVFVESNNAIVLKTREASS